MSISGISATPPPTVGTSDPKPTTAAPKAQKQASSDERPIHIDKESPATTQGLQSLVDKTA
jgi:acyl dehydratase